MTQGGGGGRGPAGLAERESLPPSGGPALFVAARAGR